MPIKLRLFLCAATLALLPCAPVVAQDAPLKTRNVVVVVSDGLRWQEVFTGAEAALISRTPGGVSDTAGIRREFWRDDVVARRAALFPFLWGTVARDGQLYGNPANGSDARTQNPLKFSYPGYNEILTGAYDPRIDSNDYPPNPNTTVFEWMHRQPGFQGRVAAVATWSAFRRIFNAPRAGIPVYDGWDPPFANVRAHTPGQVVLDNLYRTTTRLWGDNTFDALAHATAREVIARDKPRVLFVGYGETDEWAHEGRYDRLLLSARGMDAMLADLWALLQSIPEYRGTTTLIVTADHGRGDGPSRWKDHGRDVDGADKIWMAVLGPDTPPRGDRVRTATVTQAQVAATVAALLGLDWPKASPNAAPPIAEVLGR